VRAVKMPPLDFVQNALKTLPDERDEDLARNQLERIARAYQRYLTSQQQKTVLPALDNLCLRQIQREEIETGTRINYLRMLFSIAKTPAARNFLKKLLSGEATVPGIQLRAADRWRILANLLANGDEEAERLFSMEKSRDNGNEARKQAYVAEAARADAETKRRYFDDYLNNKNLPEDWIETSLANFNSPNQPNLTLPFLKSALAELPRIQQTRKIFYFLAWLKAFIGGQESVDAWRIVQHFLASSRLNQNLKLKVFEISDDLERAIRIRQKFGV
jgi:aminopeptidase N